ncbi:MAG: nucleoside 2-deoxyribosyltransferase [Desulfomonilaceae bacterium]
MTQLGCEVVFDPWSIHFGEAFREASQIENHYERVPAFARLARDIGAANEEGIRGSDAFLGVLDGAEVDSGTASGIGYAAGVGKRCYCLRMDRSDCGDHVGLPANLQLLWFIEKMYPPSCQKHGGWEITRSCEALEATGWHFLRPWDFIEGNAGAFSGPRNLPRIGHGVKATRNGKTAA